MCKKGQPDRTYRSDIKLAIKTQQKGFEPPEPFGSSAFETDAFDHSATAAFLL